jgi:hypothetical protein
MKVECTDCKQVYNFKAEKIPDTAFTFNCKNCGGRVRISKAEVDAAKVAAARPTPNAGKAVEADAKESAKGGISLPKMAPAKLKRSFQKVGALVSDMAAHSERDWVLILTKSLAYFSIGVLVVLVLVGAVTFYAVGTGRTVTYAEVARSLDLKLDPLVAIDAAAPAVKLSNVVKKHLGGDNKALFVEWMNSLDESQQADFVENLEAIIQKALKDDPGHIQDYIDEYGRLKLKRSVNRPYAQYLFRFGLLVAMIAAIGLLGLYTLVLVKVTGRRERAND